MSVADEPGVCELIALARREDLGSGDLTTGLVVDPSDRASFQLIANDAGVFCGREVAAQILRSYDASIEIEWAESGADGARWEAAPTVLATVLGPIGPVLSAERVFLNFLQRLCGVATLTTAFVDATAGTGAEILDTRKTTPGWRALEKYAVRCGGGSNHRSGLFDAVLIKDNHLFGVPPDRLAATVFDMLNRRSDQAATPEFVEVEADSLAQVEQLLDVVGIDAILLDNFAPADLRAAVSLRDQRGLAGKVALEASGGITLETVRGVAETGVDRISVGALTHSAAALDLSLERI